MACCPCSSKRRNDVDESCVRPPDPGPRAKALRKRKTSCASQSCGFSAAIKVYLVKQLFLIENVRAEAIGIDRRTDDNR